VKGFIDGELNESTLRQLQAHEVLVVLNANLPPCVRYVDAFVGYGRSLVKMFSVRVWFMRGPTNADLY
jgi:hypothetical protein